MVRYKNFVLNEVSNSAISGKLVSIKGTVIKVGQVKVICQYLAFSCPSCSGTQLVKQVDGIYTIPNNCPTKGCRVHSNFSPLHSSAFNRTISWQSIKIQELITNQEVKYFNVYWNKYLYFSLSLRMHRYLEVWTVN